MFTHEIDRAEWAAFLDTFSRHHEGKPTTLYALTGELGAQPLARHQPLVGITADRRHPGPFGGGEIQVLVGDSPQVHVVHGVTDPTHIWLGRTAGLEEWALKIERADGSGILLELDPPPLERGVEEELAGIHALQI